MCILAPAAAFGRGFSLPEYLAQLDRLSTLANRAVDDKSAANTALEELRPDWTVTSEGQSFKINTGWLTDQFEKLKDKSTVPVRDEIRQRLGVMRANAAAFQNPPADTAAARQKLTEILSRNEFHQVHGATWLERLKFRVAMWIYRTLSKMFGASSAPAVGTVFVWALVGIAVLALAYFIFRTIRQNARLETIMAAMDARDYIIPDDVKQAAPPVLRHRVVLKPEADLEGLTADLIIADVLKAVEVPK